MRRDKVAELEDGLLDLVDAVLTSMAPAPTPLSVGDRVVAAVCARLGVAAPRRAPTACAPLPAEEAALLADRFREATVRLRELVELADGQGVDLPVSLEERLRAYCADAPGVEGVRVGVLRRWAVDLLALVGILAQEAA
ncbi:hypothetical protein [Streptomyces sp. GZWMJZ-114]|uniref:hypothetical protein n=1 Tax=Streptomyces sp. GZWMJZ-114 TaxID=2494734 RepID=UPI001012C272|nr:hypothetical protein [Streptomyces sp. GZWMJZ-114]